MTQTKELMNAIVVNEFGGPEKLEYQKVQIPEPKEKQVRIKMQAIGVNPNESYVLTGKYNLFIPQLPFTPGFDGAGIIDAVGVGVSNFKVGDRVFVGTFRKIEQSGTYADYIVVDSDIAIPLPENVPFEQGAALGIPGFTAYHALFQRANIKPAETVFVHGATGGVGTLVVQMAKAFGCKVIGSSSTVEGRQAILNNGADYAVEHLTADTVDSLKQYTNGEGPDVIIEFLANKNLEFDLQAVRTKGRIVIIGARDTVEISPRHLLSRNLTVLGGSLPNLTTEDYIEASAALVGMLENNILHPVIGSRIPLKDAQIVHQDLLTRAGNGKTVLVPDGVE